MVNSPLFLLLSSLPRPSSLAKLSLALPGLLGEFAIALGPLGRRVGTPKAPLRFLFSSRGLLPSREWLM